MVLHDLCAGIANSMTWSNATYFLEFNCYWKTFLIQWHKWGYWSPVCTIDNHNNFTYIWEAKISLLTQSNIPLLVFTSMLREINNTMIFVWGWGKWTCLSQVSKLLRFQNSLGHAPMEHLLYLRQGWLFPNVLDQV